MGLFATPAVKDLREQAGFIGGLFGQAHLGHIPAADVAVVVANDGFRERLGEAYRAVAAEIGEKKATKTAISAARISAESYARLGSAHQRAAMARSAVR